MNISSKEKILVFLSLGIWLFTSFANNLAFSMEEVFPKTNLSNSVITEQDKQDRQKWKNKKNNKLQNINQPDNHLFDQDYIIKHYQKHISFIKELEANYPYLEPKIQEFHKLYSEGMLYLFSKQEIPDELYSSIRDVCRDIMSSML